MSSRLTIEAYVATKAKFEDLQKRLAALEKRTDLEPAHLAAVRGSYKDMMRQYLRDIKLYEASNSPRGGTSSGESGTDPSSSV